MWQYLDDYPKVRIKVCMNDCLKTKNKKEKLPLLFAPAAFFIFYGVTVAEVMGVTLCPRSIVRQILLSFRL